MARVVSRLAAAACAACAGVGLLASPAAASAALQAVRIEHTPSLDVARKGDD